MRIGIIGLGRIGAFHAANLAALDAVDGLVVTDAVPGVAEQVAAKSDAVAVVDSTEQLLRSGVDGVVIASSTPSHLPLLRAAVAAGDPPPFFAVGRRSDLPVGYSSHVSSFTPPKLFC